MLRQNKDAAKVGASSKLFAERGPASSVLSGTMVGSHETLARRLAHVVIEGDGEIMLIVPDYVRDVEAVAARMFPLMDDHGVLPRVSVGRAALGVRG